MNVVEREIASSSDPTDDHPWYELTVDEEAGTVRIQEEADGGLDTSITNGARAFNSNDEVDPDGDRIWALTMDGELIVYAPTASGIPPLRAHLAWYDSETDTLEVLKFVEP